jgi:uncharacterized protein YeeX (DUF496 family)
MTINEQIEWLRKVDRFPLINEAIGDAQRDIADTLEKLNRVYEAADWVAKDMAYKAPEQINYEMAQRWWERLIDPLKAMESN